MASSTTESDLAAAVEAVRSLLEDKGEVGPDSKTKVDLSSCDTAEMLDTVLRERLPNSSQDENLGRQFESAMIREYCNDTRLSFVDAAVLLLTDTSGWITKFLRVPRLQLSSQDKSSSPLDECIT